MNAEVSLNALHAWRKRGKRPDKIIVLVGPKTEVPELGAWFAVCRMPAEYPDLLAIVDMDVIVEVPVDAEKAARMINYVMRHSPRTLEAWCPQTGQLVLVLMRAPLGQRVQAGVPAWN